MKFTDLDRGMRVYETAHDHSVLPNIYMVARLDGRGFTRLTKEVLELERPFDEMFRDMMIYTTEGLMSCGFKTVYGYTQSDEISLLLDLEDDTFSRKERKINSILSGTASAEFSQNPLVQRGGEIGVFDCRISQLPSWDLVVDYFRWRQADAERNALNSYAYWTLRKANPNASPHKVTGWLSNLSPSDKQEILFGEGINYNDIPSWQKRGVGVYWESYQKSGIDSRTNEERVATRKRMATDLELPMGDGYTRYVNALYSAAKNMSN